MRFAIASLADSGQSTSDELPVDRSLLDLVAPLGEPTVVRYPFSHIAEPATFTLNCRARLNADTGALTIPEPAVA